MDLGRAAFLLAASGMAGAVNAIAGGGTLISFPAAMAAGLPPIIANATNAAALVPGSLAAAWAFRGHLRGLARLTAILVPPAVVGALVGATVLQRTSQHTFDTVVPFLVLAATLLILLQGVLTRRGGAADGSDAAATTVAAAPVLARPGVLVAVVVAQLAVSVYGGYFGAAMGIVMLAFLGLAGTAALGRALDIHQSNAIKNVLAVAINTVAALDFIAHGLVNLPAAVLMAAGAIAGGVLGGRLARRANARAVRRLVIAIGLVMTALLAYRRYG